MCVKLRTSKMKPGDLFGFRTSGGPTAGKWGLFGGQQYNARSERLDELYREYRRGIVFVDSFWEGGKEFKRTTGKDFAIGIIFNPQCEFAVLTCPANEIVKPYHHRMPLILAENWSQSLEIPKLLSLDEFILADAA